MAENKAEEAERKAVTALKIKSGELVWVCGDCGRYGPRRSDLGDDSCRLNAALYVSSTLNRSASGRVVGGTAYRHSP